MMTFWAIECSPLILGTNLTELNGSDLEILTDQNVIAVDQAGHVAQPVSQSHTPTGLVQL